MTVTEAMWKGTPVVGGNVGGMRYQIKDGKHGYLVNSVEETAAGMVTILKDPKLRDRLGRNAAQTLRNHFLMTRLLERYLDLFLSFKAF